MSGERGGPVVVAVGDDNDGHTLEWAAAEAAARRCRLEIVHAVRLRCAADPSGLVPVPDLSSYRTDAEHILRAAVRRARSVASDLDVSAESVVGPTVPVLVAFGVGAQLLVVGSHDPPFLRGLRGALTRSVSGRVAGRAPCPVAVIGPLRSSAAAGSSPRVVVGVGGSAAGTAVLGVAFRAAAQRGLPVTAVHAWSPDVPADHEAVCGAAAASAERARRDLDEAIEVWRNRFPDVPVETRVIVGEPAPAVLRESEGAALTVIGSRARRAVRTTLFGSVSRTVTQRARCPLVVVPTEKAGHRGNAVGARRGAAHPTDPVRTWSDRERRTSWE